jgi:hypothetical protein
LDVLETQIVDWIRVCLPGCRHRAVLFGNGTVEFVEDGEFQKKIAEQAPQRAK